METQSYFTAGAFGGFDFNEDNRFSPARAFKGGPDAYIQLEDKERINCPNIWLCLVDVAACMRLDLWTPQKLDVIEKINLVHLHELTHALSEYNGDQFEYGRYSHTHYWNKVLIPIVTQVETKKRSD